MSDPLLDRSGRKLDLAPVADAVALAARAAFPWIIFTSGRRGIASQARAMAANVVQSALGPGWILATYRQSWARHLLHEAAVYVSTIGNATANAYTAAFEAVLAGLPTEDLARAFRHLSGLAFDVHPIDGPDGERLLAWLRAQPDVEKVLDHEGDRIVWHVQFRMRE